MGNNRQRENKNTVSIVAVNNTNGIHFGKVLHFSCHKVENQLIESACVLVFSVTTQDKESSSLWWVNTSRFTEKIVPVEEISKPLVTAKDDEDYNKLCILNKWYTNTMRNDNGRLLERPSAKTKKTMGDRAFQVAAPFLNNELIIFLDFS